MKRVLIKIVLNYEMIVNYRRKYVDPDKAAKGKLAGKDPARKNNFFG
jgi:hypothetical protein